MNAHARETVEPHLFYNLLLVNPCAITARLRYSNLILTNVLHNFSRIIISRPHTDNYLHINGFAFAFTFIYLFARACSQSRTKSSDCSSILSVGLCCCCCRCHCSDLKLRLHFAYLYILFASSLLVIFNVQIIGRALIFILFVLAPRCSFYYNVYLFE